MKLRCLDAKRQNFLRKELAALALLQSRSLKLCHVEGETQNISITLIQDDCKEHLDQNDINELKDLTTCCPNVFKKAAFTLAEMMVVMLIMTIVLAAAAPVMTTRMKQQQAIGSGGSSIWQWVSSTKDHAYFGEGDAQMALIGQDEVAEGDSAKLIINKASGGPTNHILFKEGDNTRARLLVTEKSIFLSNNGETSAENNTIIGINAAEKYKGKNAIAIGNNALYYGQAMNYNDSGSIAIGNYALKGGVSTYTTEDEITAYTNIAIGHYALSNIKGAYNNIAIGNKITDGSWGGGDANVVNSIAIGHGLTPGSRSIGIGANATVGSIAIGGPATRLANINIRSRYNNDTTDSNKKASVIIGANVEEPDDSFSNIAIGSQAFTGQTYNKNNIVIGNLAMSGKPDRFDNWNNVYGYASHNIVIGEKALYHGGNRYPVYTGSTGFRMDDYGVREDFPDVSYGYASNGGHNIAIGKEALYNHGKFNNYVGGSGGYNIAIGARAGYSLDQNYDNIMIGALAGYEYRGDESVLIGSGAGRNTNSDESVYIGQYAGYHASGRITPYIDSGNTYVGAYAGYTTQINNFNTNAGSSPTGNTFIGKSAGVESDGKNNTALGGYACRYIQGNNKTCIGSGSGPANDNAWASADDTVERIFIGSKPGFKFSDGTEPTNMIAPLEIHNSAHSSWDNTATVVINGNLIVRGVIEAGVRRESTGGIWKPGLFQYSSASGDDIEYNGDMHLTISDRRLKNVGSEITTGLDKIKQLKVFNYTFKKDKEKTPRVGVIAQDLQKVFPNAVTKGEDGYLRIRTEDMFYAMVNAIKELDAKIAVILSEAKNLKVEFTAFNQAMKQVQNDNNRLKKENKELKSKIKSLEKRLEAIETKLK